MGVAKKKKDKEKKEDPGLGGRELILLSTSVPVTENTDMCFLTF